MSSKKDGKNAENCEKTAENGAKKKLLFLDRVGSVFSRLLNLIFIPKCVVCDDPLWDDGEMCPECLELWKAAKAEKCPICRKSAQKCTCGTKNLQSSQTVGDRNLCALVFYGKPDSTDKRELLIRRMAKIIKTSSDRRIVRFAARELAAEIIRHFTKSGENLGDWYITYPPRINRRCRQFGFDQARELSREISKFTGIPCVDLFRRNGNELQKTLSSQERARNAEESITLLSKDISGCKKVIVADDIITTGATVNACRTLLKSHGTENVFFACIARTKPQKRKALRTPADKVWFLKK